MSVRQTVNLNLFNLGNNFLIHFEEKEKRSSS